MFDESFAESGIFFFLIIKKKKKYIPLQHLQDKQTAQTICELDSLRTHMLPGSDEILLSS